MRYSGRMFSIFRRKPDPEPDGYVEFPALCNDGDRLTIHIRVPAGECLNDEEIKRLHRHGVGVRHWWLRHSERGFGIADLPQGDQPVDCVLQLPAGNYTLGVGRGDASRRIRFTVRQDGSVTRHSGQATITRG